MPDRPIAFPLASAHHDLVFYLNGKKVVIQHPDPTLLLLDYLRSPSVGLTGTKTGCGEGGCGACTVMLFYWDVGQQKIVHLAVNACLLPICSLDGKAIQTVEGLGTIRRSIHPVQYQIAKNNGSHCGYCTPGWCMAMYAILRQHSDRELTAEQIVDYLDGNICRCTGYRPILYAFKTFASDGNEAEARVTPECLVDPGFNTTVSNQTPEYPEALKAAPSPLYYEQDGYEWYRPITLTDLFALKKHFRSVTDIKYVVGNTSIGIYKKWQGYSEYNPEANNPHVFVDISHIDELNQIELRDNGLIVGGAVTYTKLINYLNSVIDETEDAGLTEVRRMALRTGSAQVRNVASLAGNTMLALQHMDSDTPLTSDVFTVLTALETQINVSSGQWSDRARQFSLLEYANYCRRHPLVREDALILSYFIPLTAKNEFVQSWKVARRRQNSSSIVNAAFKLKIDDQNLIEKASLVYGGIFPPAFRATQAETYLQGQAWTKDTIREALTVLDREVSDLIKQSNPLLERLSNFGISPDYCQSLTRNLLYKFFLYVTLKLTPQEVAPQYISAAEFCSFPVAHGQQQFETEPRKYPLTQPYIMHTAFMQATGEATYTYDLPLPPKGLYAQFVYSLRAIGRFHYQWRGQRITTDDQWQCFIRDLQEKFLGFVDLITERDIPNQQHKLIGYGKDDPIFCDGQVTCYGQAIALVAAQSMTIAQKVALYIQSECIVYEPLIDPIKKQPQRPVLSITEARTLPNQYGIFENPSASNSSLVHLECIERRGGYQKWLDNPTSPLEDCTIVDGRQYTGSQMHFYLEPQAALAIPQENDTIEIYASTQSPSRVQQDVAHVLGLPLNRVNVKLTRVGGGFGGKITRPSFISTAAAVASWKLNCSIKLALPRETDAIMIGKRHPFLGEYWVAFNQQGLIKGLRIKLFADAGNTYDNSPLALDSALLIADNCYMIENYRVSGQLCRTNKPSSTSMRGFGKVQTILIQEEAIERVAYELGVLPETIREKNFYRDATNEFVACTPYGAVLDDCNIRAIWDELKENANLGQRMKEVVRFNRSHRWRKRGISMIPLKYGQGYKVKSKMQGDAIVEVYAADGSILAHTGGVELGQGLSGAITLLTAQTLNIPLEKVRVASVNTNSIPNSTTTGADSGSVLNGNAIVEACRILKSRLEVYCRHIQEEKGQDYCVERGINYWDYEAGWQDRARICQTVKRNGQLVHIWSNERRLIWQNIVDLAYKDRVDLSARYHYKLPGTSDVTNEHLSGTPFFCYTYSAVVAEVEIDVLTGEFVILRTDILHDVGQALNPATVIGQIEGGFIQGVGYLTTEEVKYQGKGKYFGRLNTTNTWTYKVPCAKTIPLDFRVRLYSPKHNNRSLNSHLLHQSKPTGETGVLLAPAVFFAIKHAILAAREDQGIHGWFELDVPVTVQRIQTACRVSLNQLKETFA